MIKCKCGEEILLVLDLAALGKAIEEHALRHAEKEPNPDKREVEANRVIDDLISQVFKIAGESQINFHAHMR